MKYLVNLFFILLSFNIYAQQEFPQTIQLKVYNPNTLDLNIKQIVIYNSANTIEIIDQTPILYELPEFNFKPSYEYTPNTQQFISPPVFNWTEYIKLN
tara:strand:- start:463 stop:756 length:294 start_codon:yes stop_codon:yes gene_type:complete